MKILFIGDIVSVRGCEFVVDILPKVIKDNNIDFVIANGENSEDGNGISPKTADFLLNNKVDIITTGNHVFKRKDIDYYLENTNKVIRPYNIINCNTGVGFTTTKVNDKTITVINLQGTVFMPRELNPFKEIDNLLKTIKSDIIIVDFHAEATSEKRAMGFFLDGRVTAVLGTHTHVQTNDAEVLPNGTLYVSDVGMTGPHNSVLGIDKDIIIDKFLNNNKTRFIYGKDKIKMSCCVLDIDVVPKNNAISMYNYI